MSSVQNTPDSIRDHLKERVKEIVVKNLNVREDQVVDEARFSEDLGADSLDTVELVMALEEDFKCEIPDTDAEKLRTIKDVIDYLQKQSGNAASNA
jgi:acyl carrier protein